MQSSSAPFGTGVFRNEERTRAPRDERQVETKRHAGTQSDRFSSHGRQRYEKVRDFYEQPPRLHLQGNSVAELKSALDDLVGAAPQELLSLIRTRHKPKQGDYVGSRLLFDAVCHADRHQGVIPGIYKPVEVRVRTTPDPKLMNVEHVQPQSRFKGHKSSDIHLAFAACAKANSSRSSMPFGEGGRPDGGMVKDKAGNRFHEPRDADKGKIARAKLYAAAVYGVPITRREDEMFRRWHKAHPPTVQERARTWRAFSVQGNINFFIERPGLVDKLPPLYREPKNKHKEFAARQQKKFRQDSRRAA